MSATVSVLQNAQTANNNGGATAVDVDGALAAQIVEVRETAGGTCTVTLEGSFDGSNWHSAGYQRTDGQASLTRAASGISVSANESAVFQVLDPYPQIRANVSSVAGGASVTVKLYAVS